MKNYIDWKWLEAMTEEEIQVNALSGLDNPPSPEQELSRFRHVPSPKYIRAKFKMTQKQFAEAFGLPLGTVRNWEQYLHEPDAASRSYLRVIAKNPKAVIEAIH